MRRAPKHAPGDRPDTELAHMILSGVAAFLFDDRYRDDGRPESRTVQENIMAMGTQIAADKIKLKRAYAPPEPSDGARILIDRLWPRGIKETDAAIDRWLKEIAPSAGLRRWFGHRPERWPEFRRRYLAELKERPELVEEIRAAARDGPVTLVYAARDEAHNDAVVLRELLDREAAER
jgi:uncharacterized protein YeaO (DUF488 family)